MQNLTLLPQLIEVLILAFAVIAVTARLRQPIIVGLLLTGIIAGPSCLAIIPDPTTVVNLSDIGVVLMLFTIGLEMSLADLFAMSRVAFGGGSLQVWLTAMATAWFAHRWGCAAAPAVVVGFIVAMSSTAVVSKLLAETGQIEGLHGRASLAVLICQDLWVLPVSAILPVLSRGEQSAWLIALALSKAVLVVGSVMAAIWLVVPTVLQFMVRSRSGELFVLGTLLISLGTAWLSSLVNLSPALGAFLAGIVVSGSPFSHHAIAQVVPFRVAFNSLFFIAVGMLVDVRFVWANLSHVAQLVGLVVVVKIACCGLALALVRESWRAAVGAAFCLAQVGECALVLLKMSITLGLLDKLVSNYLLAISVGTILTTPVLVAIAPRLATLASRTLRDGPPPVDPPEPKNRAGHVIIAGFGVSGMNLARVLRGVGIPYVVLELNGVTVQLQRLNGEPIHYGDVTLPDTLHRLGIATARELVIVISDPTAARNAVKVARGLAPGLKIVVRTRFVGEIERLYDSGADLVVTDEMEASLRLVSVVLNHCDVPLTVRFQLVEEIARDHYGALVSPEPWEPVKAAAITLEGMESRRVSLAAGHAAVGRTLASLDLRKLTGATCISVQRGEQVFANPGPDLTFAAGDQAVLFGDSKAVRRAEKLLVEGDARLPGEPVVPRRRATDRVGDEL